MNRVFEIAKREFVATVFTRGFVIGLLVLPTMIALGITVGPRLFMDRAFRVEGQILVIDATERVTPELRTALTAGTRSADLAAVTRAARGDAAANVMVMEALGMAPKLTLVEHPAGADLEHEKAWLRSAEPGGERHLALAVIHTNAVEPKPNQKELGSYDLYLPPRPDNRVEIAVQQVLRDAIVGARLGMRGLDRGTINELVNVPRVQSITVSDNGEQTGGGGFALILPAAFMFLLFMGVMGSGQGMLTTTIEEKGSRVIEVLLSAVSPMQLMAGKLIGHMGISLLGMSVYLVLGLLGLASFSLFGLLDLSLIVYLFIFFLLAFFTIGSLMMAVGSAVNDMREAQSLMMPLMMLLIAPWVLWLPISRNPNSTLAVIVSFLPPVNAFGMLLRLSSTQPPPAWQVWLSIGIGIVGVVGAVWFASKVFRIGLLMFGRPPNLATLIRWVRAA
ncbi:MAG: ABC transporter permease [Gammaproteobacteria bacterium]